MGQINPNPPSTSFGPIPELLPRSHPAHRIRTEAEAIEIAHALADEFADGAARRDRERILPLAEVERFSQSGLWGIYVPKEYGGAGVSAGTLAEVTAIISAVDSNLGQIPQNHFYMVEAVRLGGSEKQKHFYFERVLDGDRFGNAYTEFGTRSVRELDTKVLPEGDGYVLNGRKFYSTGALYAHWIVGVALDQDAKATVVFVPRGTPGLTLVDDWSGFGQRTTGSGSTIFDNVKVPPLAVVPHQVNFDRPTPMGPLAQIIHAAVEVGIARGILAETLRLVRGYARPWADSGKAHAWEDPYTIAAIGDLRIRVDACNLLLQRAGRFVDAATVNPTDQTVAQASVAVAEIRAYSTETAILAAEKLHELVGTRSTLVEHNLDRHWRNARTHTLHDPVRWKYHHVGNFWLNGVDPPRYGAV